MDALQQNRAPVMKRTFGFYTSPHILRISLTWPSGSLQTWKVEMKLGQQRLIVVQKGTFLSPIPQIIQFKSRWDQITVYSLVSTRPCDSKTMRRHFIFLQIWIYPECVRVCERDNFFFKSKLMGYVLTAGPSAHSKSHKHFLSNSRTSSQVESVLSNWWKFRFDSFNITNPEERKMWLAQGPGNTCGFLRVTSTHLVEFLSLCDFIF